MFWFPTWSDTNWAVRQQMVTRGLNFRIKKEEGLYYLYVAKTEALISFTVTVKLICVSVFAYVKCWFSRDAAHFFLLFFQCISWILSVY